MKAPQRSKSLQIYVKPGIREDDILITVWEACARFDRPQDVFRTMLRRGLISMVESGEMPEAVIDECNLDVLVERRKRKSGRGRQEAAAGYPSQPMPSQPFGYPTHSYAPPMDHTAPWRGRDEALHRIREYDVDPRDQEPLRPVQEPQRQADDDRRATLEKQPVEPPKNSEPPVAHKRDEHTSKPPAQSSTGKKRLGDLM